MTRPRRPKDVLYFYSSSFDPVALIEAAAVPDLEPAPGLATNFLGARIEPRVLPAVLEKMAGTVERPPNPGNWHADISEWGGAFHAVAEAGDTFRMLELGCGWGCWMTNTGLYAKRLGKSVHLIGIEGDPNHLENARRTLNLNGFEADEYRLVNGVAAARPGRAFFPIPKRKGHDWGGQAVFHPSWLAARRLRRRGRHRELRCWTLPQLSDDLALDLLHIDIQGAEVDFVRGNAVAMDSHVKRVLVGTHSRQIDGALMAHFHDRSWSLEIERPTFCSMGDGRLVTRIDGVQMWRNPTLT